MLNAARAGKPLTVVADQVGSPTYTVDLAEATLDLLDRGQRGIWHIASAGETNWQEFAQATLDVFGVPATVAPITSAQWNAFRPDSAPRPAYSVFDLTPLEHAIVRAMPHWRDALSRYRQAMQR